MDQFRSPAMFWAQYRADMDPDQARRAWHRMRVIKGLARASRVRAREDRIADQRAIAIHDEIARSDPEQIDATLRRIHKSYNLGRLCGWNIYEEEESLLNGSADVP